MTLPEFWFWLDEEWTTSSYWEISVESVFNRLLLFFFPVVSSSGFTTLLFLLALSLSFAWTQTRLTKILWISFSGRKKRPPEESQWSCPWCQLSCCASSGLKIFVNIWRKHVTNLHPPTLRCFLYWLWVEREAGQKLQRNWTTCGKDLKNYLAQLKTAFAWSKTKTLQPFSFSKSCLKQTLKICSTDLAVLFHVFFEVSWMSELPIAVRTSEPANQGERNHLEE